MLLCNNLAPLLRNGSAVVREKRRANNNAWQRNEDELCFKKQGRTGKNRKPRGAILSFHVSSLHVLYPSRPTRAIFIMAHPLRQSTPRGASYDTHRRFQQLPWLAAKTLVEGNRHLDEAGTEDQGDWRHATFIRVRTGYDLVAQPPNLLHARHAERCTRGGFPSMGGETEIS